MSSNQKIKIEVGGKSLECCLHPPAPSSSPAHLAFLLTHGAGGDMKLPQLVAIATQLSKRGFMCLRFTCKGLNINYRKRMYRGVLDYMYEKRDEFNISGAIVAGRSMGARAAAMLVQDLNEDQQLSDFVKSVVCLSYPLHTDKDKSKLRDGPIMEMNRPCLLISGTADKMCDRQLLEDTISKAREDTIKVAWVDGADHSLKIKATSEENIHELIVDHILRFCSDLGGDVGEGANGSKYSSLNISDNEDVAVPKKKRKKQK